MDGSVRSGGVLKKKSTSGCLVIKKKVENRNSGGRWDDLSVNSKEKKRPRLITRDLGVSDDYEEDDDEEGSREFMRREVNDERLHNGSMGHKRSGVKHGEYDRNNVGIDVSGERKRSKLDLFLFDSCDEFEGKRMRDEYVGDRFEMVGRGGSENSREYGVGSSRRNSVVEKRRNSYFDGSSSGRSKGGEHGSFRNKGYEVEEDDVEMPVSLLRLKYQEMGDEPIRLQGKNGVLKVMVNKKKRMDLHSNYRKYDPREVDERLVDDLKRDLLPSLPVYLDSKRPENRGLCVEKEKMEVKLEKMKPKVHKGGKGRESEISGSSKGVKVKESESDGTDTALKLAPPGFQASGSKKAVKKEEERPPLDNVTAVKGKEGKARRGGSTEKQMLREKIREMLIESGWSIDYRPRRNRDYLDAVYINPNGTAYWSIVKAYDALKKQLEEDNAKSKLVVDPSSLAPLSDNLINKLTRQTKKKIEEEMKRKKKEDGLTKSAKRSAGDAGESSDSDRNEENLSSHTKQDKSVGVKLPDTDQEGDGDLSDDSPKRKSKKIKVGEPTTASHSNVLQGRTSKVIGRCTLLVRGSDKVASDGYVPYSGKRTILAWLIDSGTAQLSEKVQYMNRKRTRVMLEGWITRDGIHCGCCSKILTVSKFELHAGSKLRQPFQNIFLESGASLLQCQIDAWNRQGESVCRDFHTVRLDGDDPDDDTCGLCGDGGSLICCDSCPSTFHQICLGIQMLPSGDWHCPNCTCRFCGDASGNSAEENDSIANELTRCGFCEEKYHQSCSDGVFALPMSSNTVSFCGLKCLELYDHLQKILGVKHELEAGFAWSLIQRTDVSDPLHRGFSQRVESNAKLAVALSVMNECFLPIIDRRSGINMIHNVVYNIGSNFNRLNYCGFYTAILERGDEIVSAASIRIHGTCLAEMPFIGTRGIYRRQGMCRRLLSAIETELRLLKVEQLIIPAIPEHLNTWTTAFGFHQLENTVKKRIKSINMLVFPGTDMLQKQLVKHSDGTKVYEPIKDQSPSPVLVKNSDIDSSMEPDKPMSNNSAVGFSVNVFKDADPRAIVSNGSIESVHHSVSKECSHSAANKVNGEAVPMQNDLSVHGLVPEEATNPAITDKPDFESETCLVVNGEVASHVSSPESSSPESSPQNTSPTENITESCDMADRNNR